MNKRIKYALVIAGLQLGVSLLATAAHKLGYISQDVTLRIIMAAIGVMLLLSANRASKAVARSARTIANQRFLAWSTAAGALVWTGSWLLAPRDYAGFIAMAAVALGTFVPIAYCLLTRPKTPA